jgi:uncharacterized RDD family membrane protein YckC
MSYAYASPELNVHVTGRRVVATLIDGLILGFIYSAFRGFSGAPPAGNDTGVLDYAGLNAGTGAGWFVVAALYYILLEGFFGRTVGKWVTGIKVIKEATGEVPGVGNAFLRTILRLIDGFFSYLVGFIVVINSSRRRRLGDMAANTLVVRA